MCFLRVLSSHPCKLERTPAAGIGNGRRRLVGAYVVSIQGRSVFTVEQANLALTPAFDARVQRVTTSKSFPLPSLTLMLSTSSVHSHIFSSLHSSGSTLFVPFQGRGVRRMRLLPSLRFRTRALTSICSKLFVRLVETN
jgi:hypothetical protein